MQQYGGLTIVQDPRDAEQPAMPLHALEATAADYVVPLAQLGALLVCLTTGQPVRPNTRLAGNLGGNT